MPRLRAMMVGALLGVWLFNELGAAVEMAAGGGILATILFDSPYNARERRKYSKLASEQAIRISYGEEQLSSLANQCNQLQIMVHDRDSQLRAALGELERRDSVGAPEARKLIQSQRKALKAQKRSMEEAQQLIRSQQRLLNRLETQTNTGHDRWEETLASLERMLANQAVHDKTTEQQLLDEVTQGNRELQRTLTDLLQQLALEPRTSNVNVQDSVVMGGRSTRRGGSGLAPPSIPVIEAIPIGQPQRTTELEWLKSLPEDLT